MARSKTVVKTKYQVRNPQTGKLEWHKSKNVTKLTNASRGTNNNRPYTNEQLQLESERISEQGATQRSGRRMLSADIGNIAAQAGSAIRSLVGLKPQESTEQTKQTKLPLPVDDGTIEQLVNGGTTNAGNKRDDDDSPWVEG